MDDYKQLAIMLAHEVDALNPTCPTVGPGKMAGMREIAAKILKVGQRHVPEDDEDFPREDWRYDVRNGDTVLGYHDWVEHNREASEEDV